MKKVTLICAGGFSTGMMVNKMKKAAESLGEEVEIRATAESNFSEFEDDTDILLLGPQVSFLFEELKNKYESKGMSVSVMDSLDYGMMNGEKVLKQALNK